MSEEDVEKWAVEGRTKDLYMFSSCSSFEVLDPHDPVLSRLATQLFKHTNDYLHGVIIAGQEDIVLLEEMNRLVIDKYADLRILALKVIKTINEHNNECERILESFSHQIDQIDAQVSQIEIWAFELDSSTKQLEAWVIELQQQ